MQTTAPEFRETRESVIHVAAAALCREDGACLLTQRPIQVHLGGMWEFPGGKLEPGETVVDALKRELKEEIGVTPLNPQPLIKVLHHYSDHKSVLLDVWRVTRFDGTPSSCEGQAMQWVHPDQMHALTMPAADKPVVDALQLPQEYMVTPPDLPEDMAQFSEKLNRALSHGIRLVQLRVPGWTPAFYKRAAEVAMEMCHLHGARLMLNGAADLLKTVCAHGVHLPSRELVRHSVRPISESFWLAASCHSEEELQRAKRIGVNFVVLSPVCVTATHPLASPLGWERFKALAEGLGMPVYALGGLGIKDVQTAIHHGGQGVAAIRAFWPEDEEPQRGAS